MYQRLYDSAWQHPGIAWVGVALLFAWIAVRRPTGFVRSYLVGIGLLSALDALFTGALSPVSPALVSTVGIVFVIAGDLRLFVLVERAVAGEPGSGRASSSAWAARALGLAFVVPVLQAVAIKTWPEAFAEPRRIYLVYEALFVVLGLILRVAILPRRLAGATPEMRAWALGAVTWFVLQYALWVTSDVLILAGAEWALLLRIVPNAMYYAGFLLFVAQTAPRSSLRPSSR